MDTSEHDSLQVSQGGKKLPWERPVLTLTGTIALLVRGGSAVGKGHGNHDGDMSTFECDPPNNMCKPG